MECVIDHLHILIAVYIYISLIFICSTRTQGVKLIPLGNVVFYMSRLAQCAFADTTPLINQVERIQLTPLKKSIVVTGRSSSLYDLIPTTSAGINTSTAPFSEEVIEVGYVICKEDFFDMVYNKEYDPSFYVPSLDIADSKAVIDFLTIVGKCYEKLAHLHLREESKNLFDFCYIFCCKKITVVTPLPKPRIDGITESQVEQDILTFMKNANEMAYKLMIELKIIRTESENFQRVLQNWANMKWKREKCALTHCELFSSYTNEGMIISNFLMHYI